MLIIGSKYRCCWYLEVLNLMKLQFKWIYLLIVFIFVTIVSFRFKHFCARVFFRQEKNGWLTGWFLFRTNSPRPAVEPGQFDGSTGNIRFIDVNSRKYPRKHTWKPSKFYKWTICTIQCPPTDIEACLIFRNPPDNYNTGTNRLSVHTLDTVSTIHTRDKNIPYYGMILGTYELITSNQDLILDDDLN